MKWELLFYALLFAALTALSIVCVKEKKTRHFLCATLIGLLVAEVVLFNGASFHLWGGGYEKMSLSLDIAEKSAVSADGRVEGDTAGILTFDPLNTRIGTVQVLLELPESVPTVEVSLDITDDTSADYRYGVAKGTVVRGDHRSTVLRCEFSGEVGALRVYLPGPGAGESYTVKGIVLNQPVPFCFSALRLLLLFTLIAGAYLLIASPVLKKPLSDTGSVVYTAAAGITALCILIAGLMTVCYTGQLLNFSGEDSGNQITQEIVEAFEAGQVSLLTEPLPELLALEDPYDWSARSEVGVYYLWDHCLYEGKYYSYYGIAPVVALFWPFHLLTGKFFPTPEAVFLFGAGGILFLTLLYLTFIRRFFPKLPASLTLAGLVVVQASSGIWHCFCSPLFYEIAQSSGFLCTTAGFYFLLFSGCVDGQKLRPVRLCLASVFLALGVLCRPTLAVYCVAALIPIGWGLKAHYCRTVGDRSRRFGHTVAMAACALLPFAVFGGVQMWYNAARFGLPLDFGIQYSLTINDFVDAEYHTRFVWIGLYNYLLAVPQITPEFPFIHSNFSDLGVNGYYFVAHHWAMGLLFRALPVGAYALSGRALKRLPRSSRWQAVSIMAAVCLLCPLVILWSIWESGFSTRYCVDFSWQMLLGALCILFYLYEKTKDTTKQRITVWGMGLSAVAAVVVAFALHYAYLEASLSSDAVRAAFAAFQRLFQFWNG